MKENETSISAMTESEAARLTAENKYGDVWPAGLYVVIDDQRSVLESRAEAEALIEEIKRAADALWPRS